MPNSLTIKPSLYKRLEKQARADDCTVEDLIENLLDYRQTTEPELHQVKLNLQEALRAGRVGLWDWNFLTDEATYSTEWKQIIGYKDHEFVDAHENFLSQVHPDDLPYLAQIIEETITEAPETEIVEFRLRHKDGSYRWVMATGSIIKNQDGVPERLIGSIINITGQKQAEEALRHSEARYRRVIENLNDMFVLYDRNLKIVMANEITVAYTGIAKKKLIGTKGAAIFPVDVAGKYTALLQKVRDTQEMQTDEITLETPYGKRSLIVKHIPLFNHEGDLENVLSITHDITEHKQIQQHEFELALEKERINLLGEFVQDAAHEFRTPLSTIKSNTYLMKHTGLSSSHTTKAEQIDMQVARIQRLVDTLLMMAKLERSDVLSMTTIDVYALMKRVCDDIRSTYDGQLPDLICDIPTRLSPIKGDITYLTEAIKQIVDNAVRFTPLDGQITVSAGDNSGWIWIAVEDTGAGIKSDDVNNVFKTFWRDDEAHTTPGFGLGLSIARKIITRHEGEITVQSTIDKGTTITITLPTV